MGWNYRIILHDNDPDPTRHWMGLHEVYYDDDGRPNSWTETAVEFVCDAEEGTAGIIDSLNLALGTLTDPKFAEVLWLSDLNKKD